MIRQLTLLLMNTPPPTAVDIDCVVLDNPTGFLIEWDNKNHNIKDDINENYDIDSIINQPNNEPNSETTGVVNLVETSGVGDSSKTPGLSDEKSKTG